MDKYGLKERLTDKYAVKVLMVAIYGIIFSLIAMAATGIGWIWFDVPLFIWKIEVTVLAVSASVLIIISLFYSY